MDKDNQIIAKKKPFLEEVADARKHYLVTLALGSFAIFMSGFGFGVNFSEKNILPSALTELIVIGSKGKKDTPAASTNDTAPNAAPTLSEEAKILKNSVVVGPLKITEAAFNFGPYLNQPGFLKGLLNFNITNTSAKEIRFAIVDEVSIQTDDAIDFSSRQERISGIGYCPEKQIAGCKHQDQNFVTIAPGNTSTVNIVLRARRPDRTLKENQTASVSTTIYRRDASTDNAWMENFSINKIIASFRP